MAPVWGSVACVPRMPGRCSLPTNHHPKSKSLQQTQPGLFCSPSSHLALKSDPILYCQILSPFTQPVEGRNGLRGTASEVGFDDVTGPAFFCTASLPVLAPRPCDLCHTPYSMLQVVAIFLAVSTDVRSRFLLHHFQ